MCFGIKKKTNVTAERQRQRIQPARRRNNHGIIESGSDGSDPESDVEPNYREEEEKYPNESDRYYFAWKNNFKDHITIDNRQLRSCIQHKTTFSGVSEATIQYLNASQHFMMLSPPEYF